MVKTGLIRLPLPKGWQWPFSTRRRGETGQVAPLCPELFPNSGKCPFRPISRAISLCDRPISPFPPPTSRYRLSLGYEISQGEGSQGQGRAAQAPLTGAHPPDHVPRLLSSRPDSDYDRRQDARSHHTWNFHSYCCSALYL